MKVLHVCANPKPTEESASKQLAAVFFQKLVGLDSEAEVVNVDLYRNPPPFLSYETYRGMWYPVFIDGYKSTDEELEAAAYAKEQGELFCDADVLVLTTPMWNYALPAILKAWLDQVLTPGVAFEMTVQGPRPLHKIKKVILLVASGGIYKEEDPDDALLPQTRNALRFVGIEDMGVAWADGQNPLFFTDGEERKEMAKEAAEELAEEVAELETSGTTWAIETTQASEEA